MLPNQGSNLDFTDPESVVLPITPLGICGCKDSKNFGLRTKNLELFSWILMKRDASMCVYFYRKH